MTKFSVNDVYDFYFGGLEQFLLDQQNSTCFSFPMKKSPPLPHPSHLKLLYIMPEVPKNHNQEEV